MDGLLFDAIAQLLGELFVNAHEENIAFSLGDLFGMYASFISGERDTEKRTFSSCTSQMPATSRSATCFSRQRCVTEL